MSGTLLRLSRSARADSIVPLSGRRAAARHATEPAHERTHYFSGHWHVGCTLRACGRQLSNLLSAGRRLSVAALLVGSISAGGGAFGQSVWFPPASLPDAQSTSDALLDTVAQRLKDSLSPEMFENFGLFIYVDKADSGPLAQRMYVFEKTDGGDLALLYDWPVSTGREQIERDRHGREESTATPVGFYELDPKRFRIQYTSSQWDEQMPYAMFFSWKPNGHETGLAIHGAPGDEADDLGARASAGCVRVSPDNARTLFDLVRSQFRGPTPKLVYLDDNPDESSEGRLLHDGEGRLEMSDGYSVLVLVDDFGGDNRVSSLN